MRVLHALSRHGGLLAAPTLERVAGLTNAGTHRVVRALMDLLRQEVPARDARQEPDARARRSPRRGREGTV